VVKEFPTAPKDSFIVANADYLTKQTGSNAVGTFLVSTNTPARTAAALRSLKSPATTGAQVQDISSAGAQVTSASGLAGTDLSGLSKLELGFGVVLALAILAMTIGLLRGEATSDMRTLTAVGATARTRRSITASAAGALAFAGAIISVIGAYVALVAAYRADLSRLSSPPIASLLLIVIGLPLIAAAAAWSLGGRATGSVARQPT